MWWPTRLPPLPPAQPCRHQPCSQTEAGIPLQKAWKTGTTIPKPARRQLPQEPIPAEYPRTGIRGLLGCYPQLRRRMGQVRQARTMAPQPAAVQRGGSSALHSIRPLPSGKWLTEAHKSKLACLDKLPGEISIGALIPLSVVEGVVGPIPMGGDELKLVRQDLEAGGHRVGRPTQQPQAGDLTCRQNLHRSNGVGQRGMARCHTVHGTGFCHTGETVYQVSDPWALQATV